MGRQRNKGRRRASNPPNSRPAATASTTPTIDLPPPPPEADEAPPFVAVEDSDEPGRQSGSNSPSTADSVSNAELLRRALAWSRLGPELDARKAELDAREQRLAADADDLEVRRADVEKRESDARAGFAQLLEQAQADLRLEAEAALQAALEETRAEAAKRRTELDNDLDVLQAQRDIARRQMLEVAEQRDALEREQHAHSLRESRLNFALDAAKEEAAAASADELSAARRAISALEQRLATADGAVAELRMLAEDGQRLRLQLAGADPQALMQEVAQLRQQQAGAVAGGRALTARERERLNHLELAGEAQAEREADLRLQVTHLREQLTAREAELASAAVADDAVRVYSEVVANYKHLVEQERAHLHAMRESPTGEPFPQCSLIDSSDLHRRPGLLSAQKALDLATFTTELRLKLRDAHVGRQLHYNLDDIRLEVAGLAASQLHILQGPSGTGKTSLPTAMASALGWGHSVVPVQAGWRDRQDLLGYHNAFEQRYQETEFLRAVYEAGTPRYQDVPYFILLDEANLSYLEQYFADYLSLLELPREGRRAIPIASRPIAGAPARLEEGFRLPLPDNVWFIATANQDETTMGFAPKTIDRAHVLELRRSQETVTGTSPRRTRTAVGLGLLQAAFMQAQSAHADDAERAVVGLREIVTPALSNLRLSYAHRLETHLRQFVPVVVATGGDAGMAVDHLLATKVLYRLQNRFDLERTAVDDLTIAVEMMWQRLFPDAPERSLEILERASRAAAA